MVEQMTVGLNLDAIHAGGLHPFGCIGEVTDDPLDVPLLGFLGNGPVRRFAQRRRGEDGQPIVLAPTGAPPKMGELNHARRTVLMHLVGHSTDPRHDVVVVGMEVPERGRRIG